MQTLEYHSLEQSDKELLDKAESAREFSYNPYTKHLFGAAIRTEEGRIYQGANLFSSATGVNVCAERAAIISSFSQGQRNIEKLAVISNSENPEEILTPCGVCRQFLYGISEITKKDITILCTNPDKTKVLITSVSELFPSPYISQ